MSEGTNSDAELRIIEDEMELEERRTLGEHSLTESITTVTMTMFHQVKMVTWKRVCLNLRNLTNHQWEAFLL